MPDGRTTDAALAALRELKGKPFFLAVGFHKPHLPFVAPKRYWDLYSEKELKLATNPNPLNDCPKYALHEWGELRAYIGMPTNGPLSEEQARKKVHGYYACVSYTDVQVGRLMDELESLKLYDKTIVLL